MFTILISMFSGVALGILFRRKPFKYIQVIITLLIWVLLFLLGLEVGQNDRIVHSLPTLGLEALLISCSALIGSIFFAYQLWKWVSKKKESSVNGFESEEKEPRFSKFGGVVIVGFFLLGMLSGLFHLLSFGPFLNDISMYALEGLMFSVGFSLGNDSQILHKFRSVSPRLALLPFLTIAGTLLGSLVLGSILRHYSLMEYMAVGSGMGYYSLSSVLITGYKGAELGTIALLSNLFREIITLIFAPFLVRWFGPLASITAGGATTMDTTFPIIIRVSGSQFAMVSVFHGFITDFSVLFLVTFFCSF